MLAKQSNSKLTTVQQRMDDLEQEILTYPQADPQTTHHIADGVYLRKIIIPAGATVTGAVHLTETLDIMVYGDLLVITEEGRKRVTEPGSIFVSKAGLKKVAYANKETMWITAHAVTEIKDKTLDEIEKELWVDTYTNYQLYLENKEK